MSKDSITLADFAPVTDWHGNCDLNSGKIYGSESLSTTRLKCLGMAIGTPIFTTISVAAQIAQIAIKCAVFYHFWARNEQDPSYNLKGRCVALGQDVLRAILGPLTIVAITVSALYGAIFSPKDGRKLCATLERAQAGNFRNTSFYHIGYAATMMCIKAIRLATFQRFWEPKKRPYSLLDRGIDYGKDLVRFASTPLAVIALIAVDALKVLNKNFDHTYDQIVDYMYGEIPNFSEKNRKGSYILAPCFQPVRFYAFEPNKKAKNEEIYKEESIHLFNGSFCTNGDAW
jgi:hypothetical protein